MTREQKLEDALRQCRKFMSDAPRLDFNEDRTISGIAVFGAYIDDLLRDSRAAALPETRSGSAPKGRASGGEANRPTDTGSAVRRQTLIKI